MSIRGCIAAFTAAALFIPWMEARPAAAASRDTAELVRLREFPLSGTFRHVQGFAVTPDGGIVVVDHEAPAVLQFDAQGALVRSFSHAGMRHCEISGPEAVAVSDERVVIWDQRRHHLLQFDRDGTCLADDAITTYEIDRGALSFAGGHLVAAGDTLVGADCAFFSIDPEQPREIDDCHQALGSTAMWLLYGRSYVAARPDRSYFAVPYQSLLWQAGPRGGHAEPRKVDAPSIRAVPLPENERQIRSTRKLYYDFYNAQTVIEGVAAVADGIVLVTGAPAGAKRKLLLAHYTDGSPSAGATAVVGIDNAPGAYAVHVRGDGKQRVHLLVARGTWPSLHYSVLVYELRNGH